MRNWSARLAKWWNSFWERRYGSDELSIALLIAAVAIMYLAWIPALRICMLVALALLAWSLYRTFSANIPAREAERRSFLRVRRRVFLPMILLKHRWKNRKTHNCYVCPHCTAIVRVPKPEHQGKIRVHCPSCGHSFEKKV